MDSWISGDIFCLDWNRPFDWYSMLLLLPLLRFIVALNSLLFWICTWDFFQLFANWTAVMSSPLLFLFLCMLFCFISWLKILFSLFVFLCYLLHYYSAIIILFYRTVVWLPRIVIQNAIYLAQGRIFFPFICWSIGWKDSCSVRTTLHRTDLIPAANQAWLNPVSYTDYPFLFCWSFPASCS